MARAQGMKNPKGLHGKTGPAQVPAYAKKGLRSGEVTHVKYSIPQKLRRVKKSAREVITYVLDTNVIMGAWDALFKFEEHEVCLVGQVWQELDAHKKGHSSEAWNVRKAVRVVDGLMNGKTPEEIQKGIVLTPPAELLNGKAHTGKLFFDFSEPEVPKGVSTSLDVNHPDDRIILVCLALKKQGKSVVLVSNDGSCRVKATIAGIVAEEYLNDTAGTVQGEEDTYPGFRALDEATVESATVDVKVQKGRSIYELNHEALRDVVCNEFLVIPEREPLRVTFSDRSGAVIAESFNYLDQIKSMGIVPRNTEQKCALQLLLDPELPAVSLGGKAGSGKTYLTLAVGIQLMKMGIFKRIIFTRSAQGADEDPGFLKGTLEEKMSPWMGALWDNIESLIEQIGGDDKKVRDGIQIASLNFMKGRSIPHTLIIVDESQDLTPKALKMISTRVGEGSKIVFLGNVAQIDNPHLTEHTCGLSVFIRTLRESSLTGHVTLQSGERSAFATLAEETL